jgi:flagellar protein FlaG
MEVEEMAIEPVSSIMTVQAQGSAVQKPKAPVQVEKPESTVSSVQAAEQVDRTVSVVQNAQEKGQADGGEQNRDQQATNDQIRKAVEKLNKSMPNSEAVFGIHEKTNRVTIKIVDRGTKEVIRELPPEKTLDMIAKVWELAGILVDERR